MSIEELSSIRSISSRLRQLLARARNTKAATSIEPVLVSSEIEDDAKDISQHDGTSQQPHQAALETAARNIFFERLASCDINNIEFVEVWNLLDILQACAEHNQCEAALPLWIIEELLDSQTIDGCSKVFDYLESRRERLVKNGFTRSKQLSVLRSCNELLRRLSRAEDAVFCGRVFIFLFQSFPLGDKSAVNLRGEFHTENVTTFDTEKPVAESDELDSAEVDTEKDNKNKNLDADVRHVTVHEAFRDKADPRDSRLGSEKPGQDAPMASDVQSKAKITSSAKDIQKQYQEDALRPDNLYSLFWSLQHVFSNPPKVFDEQEFEAFKKGLELTIKKFKSMPKVPHISIDESRAGAKRKRDEAREDLASTFNPKYLTSRDLFELEMSDLTFQRHILVQALILLDFLLSLTPRAKNKIAELKAQKAMIYNYTMSDDNASWATNMRSAIASYLQEGSDGKFYYRMVDNVLSRDKNWVRWKIESCPPIERDPVSTGDYMKARSGAKRACTNRRLKAVPLGSIDLSFLSDMDNVNSLETLKVPGRFTAPKPENLLAAMPQIDSSISEKNDERRAFNEEQIAIDDDQRKFDLEQRKFEHEQRLFEDEQRKLDMDARHPPKDHQKIRQREELKTQRNDQKKQRQERKKERQEQKNWLDMEWAGLVTERASRTWRTLRFASKRRIKLFERIDEAKSLELLVRNEPLREGRSQSEKRGTPLPESKPSSEPNGIHEGPIPTPDMSARQDETMKDAAPDERASMERNINIEEDTEKG